jgi:hypothetical protein
MDKLTLAYLAGAVDADGCFMIRRSTYHARVRHDAANPVFSERVCLKQVTPQVPQLLRDVAGGGRCVLQKPSCKKNGRPLYSFDCTDRVAARLAELLLPYLKIKRRHAELLLELRKSKSTPYSQAAHWYQLEHPQWKQEPMLTASETCERLGYSSTAMLSQAIRNGTMIALPWDHVGAESPRYPDGLIDALCLLRTSTNGEKKLRRPPQLIEWRNRLWSEMKVLNKIGVYGTSVNHLVGHHTPAT